MLELSSPLSSASLQAFQGWLKFTDDPDRTDAVFDMAQGLDQTEFRQAATQYVKQQPEVAQLIADRYLPATPHLPTLLTYPQESLGYVYANQLTAANFDPEFYRKVPVIDDSSYIVLRMRQVHDIWHVVTGFGTDLEGEMGLQAFSLAQTHSPLAIALFAASLMNRLKSPSQLHRMMELIHQGWQMGLHAKPLLAQKWEEHWQKPLAQWRTELGIIPVE